MKLIDPEYRISYASIMLLYVMVMEAFDFWYDSHHLNETIAVAIITAASGLLSAGIIKKHKSFKED